jgi:hypothetical protein
MAICYRCGQPIIEPGARLLRKVKTGEWVRRRSKDGKALEVQVHHGRRVVCKRCARSIDAEFRRAELIQQGELVVAVVLILAALLYRFLR